MKLFVGCDHAGYALKIALHNELQEWGHQVHDLGCEREKSTDYPDYAHLVCQAVLDHAGSLGLLVCGTGIGMSMAANRHIGIRAALCHDTFSARMTRAHNDANILCLGSRVVGLGLATDILQTFLQGSFEGGRHLRRISKIEQSDS